MSITTLERKLTAQENLLLKAELMTTGVRLDPAISARVGKDLHEAVRYGLDYTYGPADDLRPVPMEFILLPFDSGVNFIPNPDSPYLIRPLEEEGDGLGLYRGEEMLCEVWLPPRPGFFEQKTSDGTFMKHVGLWYPRHKLLVFISNYCYYWRTGEQCRYCTIMATEEMASEVTGIRKLKNVEETARYVNEREGIKTSGFCSGTLPGRKDVILALKTADILREILDFNQVVMQVNLSMPEDFKDIERLKEAGYEMADFDMEMWDKAWFAAVCPGKNRKVGRDRWLAGLEYCTEVFGKRRVRSCFVAGIEPRDGLLEGIEYLASKGVWGTAVPWIPGPGSKLAGHRTPPSQWHAELLKECVRIWRRYGFTLEEYEYYVMPGGPHLLLEREAWLAVEEEEAHHAKN